MKLKVLCFGDSQADTMRTFVKASLLSAKEDFHALLCLGDLFSKDSDESLVQKVLDEVYPQRIPTYFFSGPAGLPKAIVEQAQKDGGYVCSNLQLLSTEEPENILGINVGVLDNEIASESLETSFLSQGVDILLTRDAPEASKLCKQAVLAALPRYHFYPSDSFLEHTPYCTQSQGKQRITREIALAPVGNTERSKWLYAFSIDKEPQIAVKVSGVRQNPYQNPVKVPSKRKIEQIVEPNQVARGDHGRPHLLDQETVYKKPPIGYVCKICSAADEHYFKDCPEKEQLRKRNRGNNKAHVPLVIDPDSCFFCLSNSQLARHLIVSIGDSGTYVVLPKGGMTQNHVIILPIDHKATLKSLGDGRQSVESELDRYIGALEIFYQSLGTTGIVFEISRSSGVHYHIQMMPVPESKFDDLVDAFHAFAETEGLVLNQEDVSVDEEEFFRLRFPKSATVFTAKLDLKKRFDLQFGRRVISDVMGVPERAHWKDCLRTVEQEAADAELFKLAFKPFDFTL